MPLLFSYGTLRQDDVQRSTFGRLLQGRSDELPGFELSAVEIGDRQVAATLGRTHHANVMFNGRPDSRVTGMVFEVTDAELTAADEYERMAAYTRIGVTLASGERAWVYVDARSAPDTFMPADRAQRFAMAAIVATIREGRPRHFRRGQHPRCRDLRKAASIRGCAVRDRQRRGRAGERKCDCRETLPGALWAGGVGWHTMNRRDGLKTLAALAPLQSASAKPVVATLIGTGAPGTRISKSTTPMDL